MYWKKKKKKITVKYYQHMFIRECKSTRTSSNVTQMKYGSSCKTRKQGRVIKNDKHKSHLFNISSIEIQAMEVEVIPSVY